MVDDSLLHYIVIHKITQKQVIVADPGKGLVKYTLEDFFKIWTGVLILIVKTAKFEKGDDTKSIFKRVLAYSLLKPQKKLLINIFFVSLLYTVLGILGSFYFRFLMDNILHTSIQLVKDFKYCFYRYNPIKCL